MVDEERFALIYFISGKAAPLAVLRVIKVIPPSESVIKVP